MRRLAYYCLRWYWRLFRPTVLGVRVIVMRGEEVLLVRMTYVNGWYLPGGGVDRGESFYEAARRELREECGIDASKPRLLGVFHTRQHGKSDHIALFVSTDYDEIADHQADPEIAEKRYFPVHSLPSDVSRATRTRLREFLYEEPHPPQW